METSTKPVLVMMVGLPASGKSTIAYNLAMENNYIVFSSDALREELYLDINDQTHNHELFVELHKRIKTALKEGNNVIYDACNLSSKRRVAFLQELKRIPCRKECIIAATPYEQCLRKSDKDYKEFYMGDDGSFTMYVDAVNRQFAKSSVSTERYDLMDDIADMFKIVKDGVNGK